MILDDVITSTLYGAGSMASHNTRCAASPWLQQLSCVLAVFKYISNSEYKEQRDLHDRAGSVMQVAWAFTREPLTYASHPQQADQHQIINRANCCAQAKRKLYCAAENGTLRSINVISAVALNTTTFWCHKNQIYKDSIGLNGKILNVCRTSDEKKKSVAAVW